MKKYRKLSALLAGLMLLSAMGVSAVSAADEELLSGDITLDGTVDVLDAVLMKKYLLNKEKITRDQWLAGDINQDGAVNIFDLTLLKKTLIQNEPEVPEVQTGNVRYGFHSKIDYTDIMSYDYPAVKIIKSVSEMNDYFLDSELEELNADYDDAWFEEHNLLTFVVFEPDMMHYYHVTDIQKIRNQLHVNLFRWGTGGDTLIQETCIFIETDKNIEQIDSVKFDFTEHEDITTENIRYIDSGFAYDYETEEAESGTEVIKSSEELSKYFTADRLDELKTDYDDAYFEKHDLVCVFLRDTSPDYHYYVSHVGEGAKLYLNIVRTGTGISEGELNRAILIETDKLPEYVPKIKVDLSKGFGEKYFLTNGYFEDYDMFGTNYYSVVITSREELETYCASNGGLDFGSPTLLDSCDHAGYDEAFFEEHNLVFAVLLESSSSYEHATYSCHRWNDEKEHLDINIVRVLPGEEATCNEAEWHIAFETDKALTPDSNIWLYVSTLKTN